MNEVLTLEVGQAAPDFNCVDSKGNPHSLKQYMSDGKSVILYFYPKDDTPGCTKEACAIRDAWSDFASAGLKVVGVSMDDERSHVKFQEKYRLPFPLIADTRLELANAYGVYGEKKFMGKTYDGIHRMSFLIGADGLILKTYCKVKPDDHAGEVLADFTALSN